MSRLKVFMSGDAPDNIKRLVRLAAKAAFYHFDFDFDGEMTVSFVDNAEIRELNNEYRKVDRETDVLSFPLMDFYRGKCENTKEEMNLDTNRLPLGDMVLSLEKARAQAQEFGHSVARECAYLTVHSVLHLLGFDHTDEGAEKAAMREKEEEILAKLGLERK